MKLAAPALAAAMLVTGVAAGPSLREGDAARSVPAARVQDLAGEGVDLHAQIAPEEGAGRVTLLVFWAPWCKPCLREIPVLNELQKFYGSEPFRVLGVGVNWGDESLSRVAQAASEHGVKYPVLYDGEGQAAKAFGVKRLPSSVLIDRRGTVRWSGPALPRDINARIKAALGPEEEGGAR